MREITAHAINPANERLKITALDRPDPETGGGASHEYEITATDDGSGKPYNVDTRITFQHGTKPEAGVNGITNEALLAIVADRLDSFQDGKFACAENAEAMLHVEMALETLKRRTQLRIEQGVEGKPEPHQSDPEDTQAAHGFPAHK